MKHTPTCSNAILAFSRCAALAVAGLGLIFTCISVSPALGADEPAVITDTKEAAQQATAAVEQAGRAAVDQGEQLWHRIDAARLKNRTPDELAAWGIMGVLVGALAGMMTSLKPTGLGKLGRLMLGLAGAFIGGIVVRVSRLDFGWGLVRIRYEELAFSLLGAILLLVLARLISARSKKQAPKT